LGWFWARLWEQALKEADNDGCPEDLRCPHTPEKNFMDTTTQLADVLSRATAVEAGADELCVVQSVKAELGINVHVHRSPVLSFSFAPSTFLCSPMTPNHS